MNDLLSSDGRLAQSFDRPSTPPQFAIGQSHDGRICIRARGEIDLATRDALTAVGLDAMRRPAIHLVVIDLGQVTFMDASGLGSLVIIQNASVRHSKSLVLSAVPGRIITLFEMGGLLGHFVIVSGEHATRRSSTPGMLH